MQPIGMRTCVIENQARGQCVLSYAGYLFVSGGDMLKVGVLLAGNGEWMLVDCSKHVPETDIDIESLHLELTVSLTWFTFSLCLGTRPHTAFSL